VRRAAPLAVALAAALASAAGARPTYFEVFAQKFGFAEGDRLYACGVCHYRWEGTGARNPFGTTVEQELYLGKPIAEAIDAAVGADPDADEYTSLEEIADFQTLPGFSCANFFDAEGAPPDWHTFVTPMVASCLDPKDVRASPERITVRVDAGETALQTLTVHNNGKDEPIEVASYGLAPGAPPVLSLEGPATPFVLQVGESAELALLFAPTGATLAETAVLIESDDPDEPVLEIPVTAIGRVQPVAPAEVRAACLRDVDRAARGLAKRHLAEWARCHADEAAGFACDAGARDRRLLAAGAALHEAVGGDADRRCERVGLTPRLVGHPETCGGDCGEIALTDFTQLSDCLACRQDEATRALLRAALGAAPPDAPPAVGREASRCAERVLRAVRQAVAKAQRLLARCELTNATAASPVDCETALAAELDAVQTRADAQLARCRDTTGLAGCWTDPDAGPACLGEAAVGAAADLVDAAFGRGE